MIKTILITALSCAVFSTAFAAVVFEDTSFSETPVAVLNTTDTTNFSYPFVSRYINSTYFALWGFYGDSDTAPITYNAYLRLLNSSNLTAVGNDTAVTLNISLITVPSFASSTDGYVVVAGVTQEIVGNTTNSTTNVTTNVTQTSVVATIFSSDTTQLSLKTLTFGGTTNSTVNYGVYQVWFDNDYFYIIYTQLNSNVDTTVYLVGFKKDGTPKFSYPLQLNTVNLTGTPGLSASSSGNILVATWRRATQTQAVYVEVNLDTSVVGDEIVLATDTNTVVFYPADVLFSQDYYVILLYQVTNNNQVGLTVSISGNTTTNTLDFTIATGYNTFSITAYGQYFDGWFIITRQFTHNNGAITATEETLQVYNYTSTSTNTSNSTSNSTNSTSNSTNSTSNATNSTSNSTSPISATTQLTLLTNGAIIQGFTLPNQSYYILALDDLQGQGGGWKNGYIGQVFYQVSDSFAPVVKSALTFIFTIVAFYLVI